MMSRFLLGFALGMGVGAGIAMLLTPDSGYVTREKLRAKTDEYASGEETPVKTVVNAIQEQRNRLEEAIEAGQRASAARQAELWARLDLTPPEVTPPPPPLP
ncbi:MAG: YtxH domain-containing protein, partial [Chloroflexota bacterium]|nr:YtxH domain-containing protein [Chloroflexota bacterium]